MLLKFPHLVKLIKDAEWEESKHPRAANGQFGSGGGGAAEKPKASPKQTKQKRKMERRAAAAQGATGAVQTLLSGGSALDKISWLKPQEKPPEKAPEAKPPKAEKKPEKPPEEKPLKQKPRKTPATLDEIDAALKANEAAQQEARRAVYESDQRDINSPDRPALVETRRQLHHEGKRLLAAYLEAKKRGKPPAAAKNPLRAGPEESPKQPSQPATFEDIVGKPPKSITVEGKIDHTKPYIMRISGKTTDHSKKLKLSQLGFKWGNQSKTWYKGIEPNENEDAKALLAEHINRVVSESGAKSQLKATIEQGKFKPKPGAGPTSNQAKPSNWPAPKTFPSNPNDGKPGTVPAHELGSLLSDIYDMEMEIVHHQARREWEPEVKLSAPIPELRRRIEEGRGKLKESMDRLTPAARYEVLSQSAFDKLKPGRRSGPTETLRALGEKGELYRKSLKKNLDISINQIHTPRAEGMKMQDDEEPVGDPGEDEELEKEGSDSELIASILADEQGGLEALQAAVDQAQDEKLKAILEAILEDEQKHSAALQQIQGMLGGGEEDDGEEEDGGEEEPVEAGMDDGEEEDEGEEEPVEAGMDDLGPGGEDKADLIQDIQEVLAEHQAEKATSEEDANAMEGEGQDLPKFMNKDDDGDGDEDDEEDDDVPDFLKEDDDEEEEDETEKACNKVHKVMKTFKVPILIEKSMEDQRIVYGVVSEPDSIDLQGDRISKEEIRKACHRFMLQSQQIGKEHEGPAKARILESYIAPTDFNCGGQVVRKGSWVMAVKIFDKALWKAVKTGDITGFSIAGSGMRSPLS